MSDTRRKQVRVITRAGDNTQPPRSASVVVEARKFSSVKVARMEGVRDARSRTSRGMPPRHSAINWPIQWKQCRLHPYAGHNLIHNIADFRRRVDVNQESMALVRSSEPACRRNI
jgi:hypothetical protein